MTVLAAAAPGGSSSPASPKPGGPAPLAAEGVGAVLLEINDERPSQNCYMQLKPMAEFTSIVEGEAAPSEHALICKSLD